MQRRKAKKAKRKGNAGGKNRTKFTLKARQDFLDHLRTSANVTLSARAINMSRRGVYDHKESNAKFAEQWEDAVAEAVDLLEAEARRRAYQGTGKPVFHQGQQCGIIQEYADGLMMFLLKAHRPGKYRERHEITGPEGGPIEVTTIRHVIVDA